MARHYNTAVLGSALMTPRRWALAAAAAAIAAGVFFGSGAPRLTLLNATIRVDYPWPQAAAMVAAAAVAGIAAAASRRWPRIAFGVATLIAALLGASRWRYRLDATADGLTSRGLLGETAVDWRDVARVEKGPEVMVVWGKGDAQVRVTTSDFTQDQRASLERAITRRVQEAQARAGSR